MIVITLLERIHLKRLPLLENDRAYGEALTEIAEQAIAGQIYDELREYGLLDEVPAFFFRALKEKREAATLYNMLLKSEADKIVAQMEHRAIKAIVLKGVWLSRRLYGNIGSRGTLDIDLLVKPEDMAAAAEVLAACGYGNMEGRSYSAYHALFAKCLRQSPQPINVELHWHLLMPDLCRLDSGRLWNDAVPLESYRHIRELAVPDMFYTLCLHGSKHVMSSVKHALDIFVALRRYGSEIHYDTLLARAREEHTHSMVIMALSVVYRLFPHLNNVKPFGECRNWFPWNQKLAWKKDSEFTRFKGVSFYFQQTVFELAQLDQSRYRFKYVQRLLFPHRDEMCTYFNVPKTTPGWKLILRWHGRYIAADKRRRYSGQA